MDSSALSTHAGSTISQLLPGFNLSKTDIPCNESGSSLIDMSVGENAVLADEIISICKDAVECGFATEHLTYPNSPVGDLELLRVLAVFFNGHFHPAQDVESTHVAVAAGASACLNDLVYSICEPGDAVLVPGPYWSEYYRIKRRRSKDQTERRGSDAEAGRRIRLPLQYPSSGHSDYGLSSSSGGPVHDPVDIRAGQGISTCLLHSSSGRTHKPSQSIRTMLP